MPDQPQKLRVGVIGAGWWSTTAHIPAIQQHPRAELTAVHRRSLQGARQVARDFGIPHAFDDWQALIDSKLCDAVIVGTTPNVHFEQTRAALQAGLHVLCEKPFTLHAAEARELVEIAQSSGLQLLISCPWHFTPHGIEARRLIRSGALGQIKMISMLMTNPVHRLLKGLDTTPTHGTKVYVEPNAGSYNDPSIAGGGQIYCQVSHAAAYLNYLTGAMPRAVSARFDFDNSPNDIYNTLQVELDGGCLVSIASTGATPRSIRNYEVRIYGTDAILLLELWQGQMTLAPFDGEPVVYDPLPADDIYPHLAPALNLVDAAFDPAANRSPGITGLASMNIIEAACRSAAAQGQWIRTEDLP